VAAQIGDEVITEAELAQFTQEFNNALASAGAQPVATDASLLQAWLTYKNATMIWEGQPEANRPRPLTDDEFRTVLVSYQVYAEDFIDSLVEADLSPAARSIIANQPEFYALQAGIVAGELDMTFEDLWPFEVEVNPRFGTFDPQTGVVDAVVYPWAVTLPEDESGQILDLGQ
jgi:hypothetical protein